MTTGRVRNAAHLVRRFFGSVVARPLDGAEKGWVEDVLQPGELELWARQRRDDQRHTYEVAREVERGLAGTPEADGPWVAAALLHDIGKVEARLGVVGRSLATVVAGAIGRPRVAAWAGRQGWRGAFGRYIDHPRRGAAMIRDAGGRPEVALWAEIHHHARPGETDAGKNLPVRAVGVLWAADRD